MKNFTYVIKDQLGIHARPAGLLSREAQKYESKITIRKGEKEVMASQLLMLMGLGVKQGEEIEITVEGRDEDQAYEAIVAFVEGNL